MDAFVHLNALPPVLSCDEASNRQQGATPGRHTGRSVTAGRETGHPDPVALEKDTIMLRTPLAKAAAVIALAVGAFLSANAAYATPDQSADTTVVLADNMIWG